MLPKIREGSQTKILDDFELTQGSGCIICSKQIPIERLFTNIYNTASTSYLPSTTLLPLADTIARLLEEFESNFLLTDICQNCVGAAGSGSVTHEQMLLNQQNKVVRFVQPFRRLETVVSNLRMKLTNALNEINNFEETNLEVSMTEYDVPIPDPMGNSDLSVYEYRVHEPGDLVLNSENTISECEANETEIAEPEIAETEIAEPKIAETEIAEPEIAHQTEIAQTENADTVHRIIEPVGKLLNPINPKIPVEKTIVTKSNNIMKEFSQSDLNLPIDDLTISIYYPSVAFRNLPPTMKEANKCISYAAKHHVKTDINHSSSQSQEIVKRKPELLVMHSREDVSALKQGAREKRKHSVINQQQTSAPSLENVQQKPQILRMNTRSQSRSSAPKLYSEKEKQGNDKGKPDNEKPNPDNQKEKRANDKQKPDNKKEKPDNKKEKRANDKQKPDKNKEKPENVKQKPENKKQKPEIPEIRPRVNSTVKWDDAKQKPPAADISTIKSKSSFQCQTCQKVLKNKHFLKEHMWIHTNERPFECDICHKKFRQNSVLSMHKKRHRGILPHECSKCDRAFVTKHAKRAHEMTHIAVKDRERNFLCQYCSNTFTSKESLLAHIGRYHPESRSETYDSSKRPTCSICAQTFICTSRLNYHVLNKHAQEKKAFTCDRCGFRSSAKGTLQRHIKIVHEKIPGMEVPRNYACPKCNRKFMRPSCLKRHAEIHQTSRVCIECSVCSKLVKRNSIRGHMKIHQGPKSILTKIRPKQKSTNVSIASDGEGNLEDELEKSNSVTKS